MCDRYSSVNDPFPCGLPPTTKRALLKREGKRCHQAQSFPRGQFEPFSSSSSNNMFTNNQSNNHRHHIPSRSLRPLPAIMHREDFLVDSSDDDDFFCSHLDSRQYQQYQLHSRRLRSLENTTSSSSFAPTTRTISSSILPPRRPAPLSSSLSPILLVPPIPLLMDDIFDSQSSPFRESSFRSSRSWTIPSRPTQVLPPMLLVV
eukprot:TRINITY_DN4194_c0_g1::TRINITY_DN4194_c0_g1_i1::g.2174::m.2174 TRINITY_DN4194_c0_g1::TRINITY_DN4194_c0_g1_i1::g.2174  ORF type:complete len:203 (-),score=21.09,DUF4575/PF15143.1/0.1 TRINITY_DN4194_c0_g1_i1:150-758(-)